MIIPGSASKELAKLFSENLGYPLANVEYTKFPNGEFKVGIKEDELPKTVYIVQSTYEPQGMHYFEAYFLSEQARDEFSVGEVIGIFPFMGFSREYSSIKRIFKQLKNSGINRAITFDAHFHREEGKCDDFDISCHTLTASKPLIDYAIERFSLENPFIISPDKGGKEIVSKYEDKYDATFLIKERLSPDKVRIVRLANEELDVEGRNIILNDDTMGTCDTMIEASEYLKSRGAERIIATATHAELVHIKDAYNSLAHEVSGIVVTDTIPNFLSDVVSVSNLIQRNKEFL
ncbi:MAG: ribose-phosphate diphosphokinase [Methanosarcinales archaeon]